MAPDNRYTSGRSLVLSILCLQAFYLQVTSGTWVVPSGPLSTMMVAVAICCILVLLAVFIIIIIAVGQSMGEPRS